MGWRGETQRGLFCSPALQVLWLQGCTIIPICYPISPFNFTSKLVIKLKNTKNLKGPLDSDAKHLKKNTFLLTSLKHEWRSQWLKEEQELGLEYYKPQTDNDKLRKYPGKSNIQQIVSWGWEWKWGTKMRTEVWPTDLISRQVSGNVGRSHFSNTMVTETCVEEGIKGKAASTVLLRLLQRQRESAVAGRNNKAGGVWLFHRWKKSILYTNGKPNRENSMIPGGE